MNTHVAAACIVSHQYKPNVYLFAAQIYLYGVGDGQAFHSRTDDLIIAENYEQTNCQGHGCSHEVQPEGEPACARVKQEIVVGVNVTE